MVRILWFKEVSRWTRRGIPLKIVWVSPRQLAILFFTFLVGLLVSTPLPSAIMKIASIGVFMLVGTIIAFWKVKMLTPEQIILARFRGLTTLPGQKQGKKVVEAPAFREETAKEEAFKIEADEEGSFTPLSITGKYKRTKIPRKVTLYVDGVPRPGTEALAVPINETESKYTIIFLPTMADIGVRELEVRIEGEDKPIFKKKVEIKVKGVRSLEMKRVS